MIPNAPTSPANATGDSERDDGREGIARNGWADRRQRVLITVRGGVADALYDASQVMVEIFDYDEYAANEKDPDAYLDDLVRDFGFPDPREPLPEVASLPDIEDTEPQAHCDHILYKLVTEDAQAIAEKELGRELTVEELEVVERRIGDYIDWCEAMTFCLRERIAGEL